MIRAFVRFDQGHVSAPEFLLRALKSAYPATHVSVSVSAKDAEDDLIDDAPACISPYYGEYKCIRDTAIGGLGPG